MVPQIFVILKKNDHGDNFEEIIKYTGGYQILKTSFKEELSNIAELHKQMYRSKLLWLKLKHYIFSSVFRKRMNILKIKQRELVKNELRLNDLFLEYNKKMNIFIQNQKDFKIAETNILEMKNLLEKKEYTLLERIKFVENKIRILDDDILIYLQKNNSSNISPKKIEKKEYIFHFKKNYDKNKKKNGLDLNIMWIY